MNKQYQQLMKKAMEASKTDRRKADELYAEAGGPCPANGKRDLKQKSPNSCAATLDSRELLGVLLTSFDRFPLFLPCSSLRSGYVSSRYVKNSHSLYLH